ncbi:MAG: EutN/CcmL family microcompartment protein [Pirellulales bacterium]
MRVAQVIGTVTLSRLHPSLKGGRFALAVPLSLDNLLGRAEAGAEELVVYDLLGAAEGCRIAISEGGEAAQPFGDEMKPVDAYNAAILDSVDVDEEERLA